MNETPQREWVDLSEACENISKILFILTIAAFLFFILCDYYLTDAVQARLKIETVRNEGLKQEADTIRKQIEFNKGRIASFMDPVTEWWYATFKGQESFKMLIINKVLLFTQIINYDNARIARQWRMD